MSKFSIMFALRPSLDSHFHTFQTVLGYEQQQLSTECGL